MTVVISAYRTEKTRSIRLSVTKYDENGDRISHTTGKVQDVPTTRAMVDTLRKSNIRANRIHIKYAV